MAFIEQERQGEICGCRVVASPVGVCELAELESAQGAGSMAVLRAMCKIVHNHVRDDEGVPISAEQLSPKALRALFDFAVGSEDLKVADFSAPRD